MRGLEKGRLVRTDKTCILKRNAAPGVWTLVWSDGIDEYASDYFRYLYLDRRVSPGTLFEYAKIIRGFIAFARSKAVAMRMMSDAFLTSWIDWMRSKSGISGRRVNTSLGCAFAFLKWLERSGRIRHVVGIYEVGQASDLPENFKYPVAAVKRPVSPSRSKKQRYSDGWTTTLFLKGLGSSQGTRHTPTEDEIRRLHSAVFDRRHATRDMLMFSWPEETGARRADILSINIEQIPDDDTLCRMMDRDEQFSLAVVRKGRTEPSMLYPTFDLLIRTRNYIEMERAELVRSKSERIPEYIEPSAVFLSGLKGERLTEDALTKLSSKAFKAAGIANASLHRLRASFAVNAVEALLDSVFVSAEIPNLSSWEETIATKLMELMGHSSRESLSPYIQFVLRRRMKGTIESRAKAAEVRLRNAELELDRVRAEILTMKVVREFADAILNNQPVEARRLHSAMLKRIPALAA